MARQPAAQWTDEMLSHGRDLFKEGYTAPQVAECLGVSRAALESRIVRDRINGIYWRPHTPRLSDKKTPAQKPAPDPRSLTGKLMGDPLPGRSAADCKKAFEAWQKKSALGWW